MATVMLVEYSFDPPLTDAQSDEISAKLSPCLQVREVEWVTSFLAADRRKQICVFRAADAETVRQAFRSAGVAFERVWPADQIV